jgi:transposase
MTMKGSSLCLRTCSCPTTIFAGYKGYDTDAIRAKATARKAWANIPPKANRERIFAFSGWVYRQRNLVERPSTGSISFEASPPAMTRIRPTSSPRSNSSQGGSGAEVYEPTP